MALKKMVVPSQGFNFVIFRGGEDWLVISLSQAAGRAAALSRGEHQPEKIVFSSLRKRGKKEFWLKKKRAARFQCLNFVGLFSGGEDWSACKQLDCLAHCREETCCRQLNKLCLSFFLSSGEREKKHFALWNVFFLVPQEFVWLPVSEHWFSCSLAFSLLLQEEIRVLCARVCN